MGRSTARQRSMASLIPALDLGVAGIAELAEVGGRIRRADEHRVHALHGRDLLQRGQGLPGLELEDDGRATSAAACR